MSKNKEDIRTDFRESRTYFKRYLIHISMGIGFTENMG
jgi:hypothetical protein